MALGPRASRPRPSDLPLTNINSPTNPDDEIIPYDQILPILSEDMEEIRESGRNGISNQIIQRRRIFEGSRISEQNLTPYMIFLYGELHTILKPRNVKIVVHSIFSIIEQKYI